MNLLRNNPRRDGVTSNSYTRIVMMYMMLEMNLLVEMLKELCIVAKPGFAGRVEGR